MSLSPTLPCRPRLSRFLIPALIVLYLSLMALTSHGFLDADEITHYLMARGVWHDWTGIVGIWGRLGATALYATTARLGPAVTQLVAVAVTALTALGTAQLAKLCLPAGSEGFFRRHACVFAWLLLLAQPCVLLYSFAIMTEMPLACAWVWAMVALCRRRVLWAGVLMGIGGLMRPEGWIAIAAWPACLLLVRYVYQSSAPATAPLLTATAGPATSPPRPAPRTATWLLSTLLAGLPVLGWYLLGVYAKHITAPGAPAWKWCITDFPWSAKSQYGHTGLQFLLSCAVALGFWMWVPFALGCRALWRRRREMPLALVVLLLPVAGFFLLHGTLGSLGLFGSLSLPRYFICVAPMLAVVCLLGLIECQHQARRWLPITVIVLSCLPVIAFTLTGNLPERPLVEFERLDVVVTAINQRNIPMDHLIVSNPWVLLRLGDQADALDTGRPWHPDQIRDAPPGTAIVMDSQLWKNEGRPSLEQLKTWGYREDPAVAARVQEVSDRYEALTFNLSQPTAVGLWIKQ